MEPAWVGLFLAEPVGPELHPGGRGWVDAPLIKSPGAPLLPRAGPAKTSELPSPNTPIRQTMAIRVISILLQLLPHGPPYAGSVRLTIFILDLPPDKCKQNCPGYQTSKW